MKCANVYFCDTFYAIFVDALLYIDINSEKNVAFFMLIKFVFFLQKMLSCYFHRDLFKNFLTCVRMCAQQKLIQKFK